MAVAPGAVLPALATLVGGGLLAMLLGRITGQVLKRLTRRTATRTDDVIAELVAATIAPLGWVIAAGLSWQQLGVDQPQANRLVLGLANGVLVVLVVRLINQVSGRLLHSWAGRAADPAVATMLISLAPMLRALVWCIGAAIYLQNLGVQMAAIWALLSAGGIGAGLALKEPVQEFFEYITILLDKPFQSGQVIAVAGITGRVERVGVRSTRLRSVNGEAIVMSNSALTSAVVANYGDMQERRLVVRFGVLYDTPVELLERIPELVRSIVEAGGDAAFNRCHFVELASSSLDFELAFTVPSNDYDRALDVQQRVNLEIMRRFNEAGIGFAFPSRTVYTAGLANGAG